MAEFSSIINIFKNKEPILSGVDQASSDFSKNKTILNMSFFNERQFLFFQNLNRKRLFQTFIKLVGYKGIPVLFQGIGSGALSVLSKAV